MRIERVEEADGTVWYRLHSDYAKDSLVLLPGELLQLMRYLTQHEGQLGADSFHEPEQARRHESFTLEEGGTLNDPSSPPD